MRKKLAAFLAAAFVVAWLASPAFAKPSADGRAGSTIVAARN